MPPRAFSYLRFSTPEQMSGDSFRRQTALAADYAANNGLDLDTELNFHDLGLSAFRGKNSEVGRLADFLDAVRKGLVPRGSFLLVESLDRISRQAARKALRVLESICEEDITVVTLSDNRAYTKDALDNDPMALIMSLLVFIRASEESQTKSKRLRSAWHQKRKEAGATPLTAKCPGWLRLDKATGRWEVIPERAQVVRRVYEETLKGVGQHSIAQGLNRDGIPVFGGAKLWHRSYVSKLLASTAVVGLFTPMVHEYSEGRRVRIPTEPLEGYFPSVVDPEVYERVRALRRGTKAPRTRSALTNLFSGLLKCSRCGHSVVAISKGPAPKGSRYLVCSSAKGKAGCKYTAVRYEYVEGAFLDRATELVSLAPSGPLDALDDTLESSLWVAEDTLAVLRARYARQASPGLLGRIREAEVDLESLRVAMADLEARRALAVGPVLASRLRELVEALEQDPVDVPGANALMRLSFTSGVLDFDLKRLVFQWKQGGEAEVGFGMPEAA